MPSLVSRVSRLPVENDDEHLTDASNDDALTNETKSEYSEALSTAMSASLSLDTTKELPVVYAEPYRAMLVDQLLLESTRTRSTSVSFTRGIGAELDDSMGNQNGSVCELAAQPETNLTPSGTPNLAGSWQRPSRFETPHGSLDTIVHYLENVRQDIRAENISEKYVPGTPAATLEVLDPTQILRSWRVRDRFKTAAVALVLCLNVGVDPPDVIKPTPCARVECWIDPFSMSPQKALDSIGKALQLQYERWQPRARYRVLTDPVADEVKKLCLGLRRTAREERVLFHFNGHGVPRPTANGEIWVFNRNYTQYIPLSLYDLQSWLGAPAVYVFDCPAAGLAIRAYLQFAEQREHEQPYQQHQTGASHPHMGAEDVPVQSAALASSSSGGGANARTSRASLAGESLAAGERAAAASSASSYASFVRDSFLLGACQADESLPTTPDLPADLFTACLTTPIKIALRWQALRSAGRSITMDMIDRIPGRLNDRKTMLGELNWIFTAVTDTIAWNTFPRATFKRLYRQDLLVASLFRNFLLADRLMRQFNCTPVSYPPLQATHQHPLWQAWDHAVEECFARLPSLLQQDASEGRVSGTGATTCLAMRTVAAAGAGRMAPAGPLLNNANPLHQGYGGMGGVAVPAAAAVNTTVAQAPIHLLPNAPPDPGAPLSAANHLMRPEPRGNLEVLHDLYDYREAGTTSCRTHDTVQAQTHHVGGMHRVQGPGVTNPAAQPTLDLSAATGAGSNETGLTAPLYAHSPSEGDVSLPSPFFENQMAAFEVWLDLPAHRRSPPEQLPIVLQVLLSQAHRLRALQLLSRFLDTGPWAVDLALSVGIFPYVLRLLQSPAAELRAELVFIWAKILAVDPACTEELFKESGERYFLTSYAAEDASAVHLACAAFVLCHVLNKAVDAFGDANLLALFLQRLEHASEPVRRWTLFCLTAWMESSRKVPSTGTVSTVLELLRTDLSPKVRAAAAQTLATMLRFDYCTADIIEAFQQSALNEVSAVVRKEIALVTLPANRPAQTVLVRDPHPVVAALAEHFWATLADAGAETAPVHVPGSPPRAAQMPAAAAAAAAAADNDIDDDEEDATNAGASQVPAVSERWTASRPPEAMQLRPASATGTSSSDPVQQQQQQQQQQHGPRQILRRASASWSNLRRYAWSSTTAAAAAATALAAEAPRTTGDRSQTSSAFPTDAHTEAAKAQKHIMGERGSSDAETRTSTAIAVRLARPQSQPELRAAATLELEERRASRSRHGRLDTYQPRDLFRFPHEAFTFSRRRRMMHIRDYSYQEVLQSQTRERWSGHEPMEPTRLQQRMERRSEAAAAAAALTRLRERWVTRLQAEQISALCFHPSQQLVLSGDASGNVVALQQENGERCWRLGVGSNASAIAALRVVNAHTTWPLLLVATADGIVRFYESQQQVLAAFSAISQASRMPGMTDATPASPGTTSRRVSATTPGASTPRDRELVCCTTTTTTTTAYSNTAGSRQCRSPSAPAISQTPNANSHATMPADVAGLASPPLRVSSAGGAGEAAALSPVDRARYDESMATGRAFVCDWSPWHGWLLTGGLEQGTIRLFDAEREMCIWSCIASSYRVTAVAHLGSSLFAAGCADGSVYTYDTRTGAIETELLEHSSPVISIAGRWSPTPALVTAAAAGDVRVWPLAAASSSVCVVAHRRDLTAAAAHQGMPWIATGCASRCIKLFGEQGQLLQLIRHHDGAENPRIGSISCLEFAAQDLMLAAGDVDSSVTLYTASSN